MSRYAENTEVPADRSRQEIERILQRYGATAFMYGWEANSAVIAFQAQQRRVRFLLPLRKTSQKAHGFSRGSMSSTSI